jgi:signal transduction histidine kinase
LGKPGLSEGGWWRQLVARSDLLLPSHLRTDDDAVADQAARARIFLRTWLVSIAFGAAQAAQYTQTDLWGQVVLNAGVAGLGVALLVAMRLGAPLRAMIHVSLGVPAVAFVLGSLAQTPFDVSSVFFLVIVPLLASYVLGPRAATVWAAVSLLLGCGAMWLGAQGYVLPQVDQNLPQTQALNFAFILVLVSVVSIAVHQLRARAFRELDLASRAKSAFLANMSHEIRTPMNGVLGLTEVMLSEPMPPHQRERLELIQRSGEVLISVINDVLDVSRVEAGKLTLDFVQVDLRSLARDVCALFKSAADQKGLVLVLELADDLPMCVRADPTRLRQVLSNLVGNAVKFTASGRVRLTLATVPNTQCVCFSVDDTGVGIAPEVLPRLFTPFEQGDAKYSDPQEGDRIAVEAPRWQGSRPKTCWWHAAGRRTQPPGMHSAVSRSPSCGELY